MSLWATKSITALRAEADEAGRNSLAVEEVHGEVEGADFAEVGGVHVAGVDEEGGVVGDF